MNGIKRGGFWLTRRLLLGLQLCGGEEERFRLIFLGVFACIQCTCLNINLSTLSHLWVGLLKKRTIFAHVLVCISHVLAAEPRRFLAILLVKRNWDQKKTAVFPPYLKVVVACFVCVVERVGWTHHFGAFFCLSYVMCTKEIFLIVYLYHHVLGVLTSLWGACCISQNTLELSPTIAPGQCALLFESLFLAVTANYFILRYCYTWI